MLTLRDPIHGFIRADELERRLIDSAPIQRLRHIRQLAFANLIFPGAEHSRFSHVLGAMELAGNAYDALAAKSSDLLDPDPRCPERRSVRAAALLHDIGHAPFSHSAEELFTGGIDHEEMTRRLLHLDEVEEIFAKHGEGVAPESVSRLLSQPQGTTERLLSQIISGELDVDKMDYLLRDSLYCGVRYGSFDLHRLLDTIVPLEDPDTGELGLGVEEGGVHALEALVMARYYMFTQVYFNVTGKALEHHFSSWLTATGRQWSDQPEEFLAHDDISTMAAMRRSKNPHARAVAYRRHYPVAFETREHLSPEEKSSFDEVLARIIEEYGSDQLLISNSSKDPHRLGAARVLVRRYDGKLEPMEEASHFIRHLARIERYRVYAPPALRDDVAERIEVLWQG